MFIVNVEGAILYKQKWLLIKRGAKDSLVGGKVEFEGSSLDVLERTVKREIYEEVGIEITGNIHFLYSSSFVLDDGRHVINVVFLCKHSNGIAYSKSPDEVEEVCWMTFDEIMNHSLAPPWTKESIIRAENHLRNEGDYN